MDEYLTYNEESLVYSQPRAVTGNFKSIVFWVILGLSCSLALFFYRMGYLWVALSIVGIVMGIAMFIAPQIAFYTYFAWQALDSVFLSSSEAVLTPAKAFSFFILIIYILSFSRIRQRILASKPIIIVMLLFGFIGLMGAPLALSPSTALRYSLQIFVQTLLVIAALHFLDNEKRVYAAFFWCFMSGIFCSVAMIFFGISRQLGRATLGEYANPVTTGVALSLALISIAGLWTRKRPKIYYVVYIASSLLILYWMMKTGSRSPLIAIFFGGSLGALLAKGTGVLKKVLIPTIVAVFIAIAVSYILSLNALDEVSQRRLSVLASGKIEGEGKGAGDQSRTFIWKRGFSTYIQYRPVTGFGFGNTGRAILKYRGEYKGIHSSILEPLMDAGPAGFCLWMYGLFLVFIKIRNIKNARLNVVGMIIFIFTILSLLTHSIHFTKWFWIPLTLCLLVIEQDKREQLQSSNPDELESLDHSEQLYRYDMRAGYVLESHFCP